MPEKIAKYKLLGLFKVLWNREDITIEPYDGYFCDKSMVCTRRDFDYRLPVSYRVMLQEMKDWMIRHSTRHQGEELG